MHLIVILEIFAQVLFIQHALKTHKPRHWIFILLIPWAGFLIYLIFEILPHDEPNDKVNMGAAFTPSAMHSKQQLAYITQGKLFQKLDQSPVEEIQSRFGQKIIDQTLRIHQKDEWKTKSSGSHLGGSLLWGVNPVDADAIRVNITSVSRRSRNGQRYYILASDTAGGLFEYDCRTQEEKRLFHKEKFLAKDLDIHPETGEFVCSQSFANGTANIVSMNPEGLDLKMLTEGDSVDECPAWIPGKDRRLLFQSAGIARNQNGYSVGRGASAICLLDLDNQRMATVLEDPRFDFMHPRMGKDDYLYYIRRPYESNPYPTETAILDFFLLPFRLLRAFFHYLNFFSLVYSNKPLTTAGGPKVTGNDMKHIVLKGKIIDAEKALRKGNRVMGVPSLVPSSWELMRRAQDGREEVLACHAVTFDVSAEGTIVYSNGCGIFELNLQKGATLLLQDKLIENLVVG